MQNESINFSSMLKYIAVRNERTNRNQKLIDHIENQLDEVKQKVYQYASKGSLIIKFDVTPDPKDRTQVKVSADVSQKLPKAKNELVMYQDEKGDLYVDDPQQQKMLNVVNMNGGKKENAEGSN
jgi:hypothetical protein